MPIGVFFVVFGLTLLPAPVMAGFFSSLLGDQAYADTPSTPATNTEDNSQTMALLQANVLSIVSGNKDDKKTDQVDEGADVSISDNALLPQVSPLGSGDSVLDPSADQTSVYVVRSGDTVQAIAKMFDVSVNTILAANDMKKGDKLNTGDVLFILPISGIEHTVAKGQTLQSIAKLYNADIDDILLYNEISLDSPLVVGDKLMIPGGDMLDEGGDKPAANLGGAPAKDKNYYATHPIQSALGYFINPAPSGRKTQGLHGPGHRGIDIGAPTGSSIYASASGTVLLVKTGCVVGRRSCGGGYGNMVIIQHTNGTKTLYAHMSKTNTSIGASVKQGQLIGYVGSTGHSTGPHLHFEVFNAKNPGADWSWKK